MASREATGWGDHGQRKVSGAVLYQDGGSAARNSRFQRQHATRCIGRVEEEAARQGRSQVNQGNVLGKSSKAMDAHCLELSAVSRAVDPCERTLCSDISQVRTWVTSEMAAQQTMVLRMMQEMVMLGKAIGG